MQKNCTNCGEKFDITDEDLAFYESVSPLFAKQKYPLPVPTFCPQCRLQRRLAFLNQIIVYSRTSSASGKRIFSMFPEHVTFPVYENDQWWSDAWNELDSGRAMDWSCPFFEQHQALQEVVPHFALLNFQNEDCDFCNNTSQNKRCYLCFNTRRSEDCFCCERIVGCTSCLDCTDVGASERCYACIACNQCYDLQESQECTNCSDSYYLLNCRSCRSCFGCVNLRHAEYCIYNKQHTKEEYEIFLRGITFASCRQRGKWRQKADVFWQSHPRPHAVMNMVENVSGNYLFQCKNVKDSYFMRDGEDLRFCALGFDGVKNCYDFTTYGDRVEHVYDSVRCGNRFVRSAFCYYCYDGCSDLYYCSYCVGCQDCFGCIGLRKKRYCILNKQYTKEEYEALVPKVIDHMRSTGEWGEFFPITLSPTAYNHTFAQRYFPMTQREAQGKGLEWEDDAIIERKDGIKAADLPDIAVNNEGSLVIKSAVSGKAFSITTQELQRYDAMKAPLPRTTYFERMEKRASVLGGMTLYSRQCARSGKPLMTVIPPDAPWIVWDKDEYEKAFSS